MVWKSWRVPKLWLGQLRRRWCCRCCFLHFPPWTKLTSSLHVGSQSLAWAGGHLSVELNHTIISIVCLCKKACEFFLYLDKITVSTIYSKRSLPIANACNSKSSYRRRHWRKLEEYAHNSSYQKSSLKDPLRLLYACSNLFKQLEGCFFSKHHIQPYYRNTQKKWNLSFKLKHPFV